MTESRAAGEIFDLGYQRYTGDRRGRWYAFLTLLAFSFRTAFGVGRGERSKSLPILVAAIVYLPAMIQIGVASIAGTPSLSYSNHLEFTAVLLALFAAAQAPELIVTDRQQGILSLYLSRPIRPSDYAFAKLAALAGAMLVLTLGPQLMMFLGRVFLDKAPWATFMGEWPKLFPILGGTLLVSLFFASVGLGLSSLASRRGYASATVIAFFLMTTALSQMVQAVAFGSVRRYAVLANPAALVSGFSKWLFDIEAARRSAVGRADLPGHVYLYVMMVVIAIATALLVARYRKGEA